ncbi:MAG: hypothetical protein ACE5JP_05570 [Candidatus Bipolaricaulia bacterium]
MSLKILRNVNYQGDSRSPRYHFELNLKEVTGEKYIQQIPIYWKPGDNGSLLAKESYRTSVIGRPLEAPNLSSLARQMGRTISGMLRYGRLPSYLFVLQQDGTWERISVYQRNGELCARYQDGPLFTSPDLLKLRSYLGEYLIELERIDRLDSLEILQISEPDLGILPAEVQASGSDSGSN